MKDQGDVALKMVGSTDVECIAVRRWALSYRPQNAPASRWDLVRIPVIDGVLAASPSQAVAKKLAPHATSFALWTLDEGGPSFMDAIADADWIERYISVGMSESAESTRATRRAALRRIGRRVGGSGLPAPEPLKYRTLKPPYRGWEVSRFLELSGHQPTEARAQSLGVVLCLGLGVGLDGRDMAWVRGCDVRREAGHLLVRVGGGSRPREVVALDRHASTIEWAAARQGEHLLIGGSTLGRHNVTSVVLTRMISDRSLPTLVASRLRSTWLTTHLNLSTPLSVLLPAAGLATARPLGDLIPYVDTIPPDRAASLLSGTRS